MSSKDKDSTNGVLLKMYGRQRARTFDQYQAYATLIKEHTIPVQFTQDIIHQLALELEAADSFLGGP